MMLLDFALVATEIGLVYVIWEKIEQIRADWPDAKPFKPLCPGDVPPGDPPPAQFRLPTTNTIPFTIPNHNFSAQFADQQGHEYGISNGGQYYTPHIASSFGPGPRAGTKIRTNTVYEWKVQATSRPDQAPWIINASDDFEQGGSSVAHLFTYSNGGKLDGEDNDGFARNQNGMTLDLSNGM